MLIWRLRDRLPRFGAAGWLVIAVAMLFPALPGNSWLRMIWVVVLFPLCVVAALPLQVGVRAQRICTAVGLMSYPLYILHRPILSWVTKIAAKLTGGEAWTSPVVGVIAIGVILGATVVATYLIEPWMRAVLARLLTRLGWSGRTPRGVSPSR